MCCYVLSSTTPLPLSDGVLSVLLFYIHSSYVFPLGGCTILDEELIQELLRIGQAAGPVLEMARLEDQLQKLHHGLNVPDLKDIVLVEKALDTAIMTFPGIREVCLVGISEQAGKPLTLVQVTPLVCPTTIYYPT